MPGFASKKQYRMMMAILHEGNKAKTKRGDSGPPRSVIERYSGKEDDLPDSKDQEHRGGKWDHKKNKVYKSLKNGVGIVIVDPDGLILMGRSTESGQWSLPGGHIEEGETAVNAAIRELEEETGFKLEGEPSILEEKENGDRSYFFKLKSRPAVKNTNELQDVGFYNINTLDLSKVRLCCISTLKEYAKKHLKKSTKLVDMIACELLEKNIIRSNEVGSAVHEFTHGDAIKLIGNGTFRILRDIVKDMENDTITDKKIGSYTVHIRKHANDIYSGRIDDGLKTIHQFVNRSLPALTGELMSVFEWYLPEDTKEFEVHGEEALTDDTIKDGISKLVHNYRTKNLADIYDEMENIREEIRNGNAIDLQQAEQKIMKLFDKIETTLRETQDKHNSLTRRVGDEIDELENKLLDLQSKIDSLSKKPSKVEAFSTEKTNPNKILNEYYSYLPKPRVIIEPSGRIIIDFAQEWTSDDKGNFLNDMKAKIIKRK